MSGTESRSESAIQLAELQDLYDRHQYLDAYNVTLELWQPSTDVLRLSTEELILAGRLAARLGGLRLSRWLLREALKRDPSSPRVRYFARGLQSARLRLLDDLKTFNADLS